MNIHDYFQDNILNSSFLELKFNQDQDQGSQFWFW